MGYKNRELEIKLDVKGETSLAKVNTALNKLYGRASAEIITGTSKDVYWKVNRPSKADFLRLRYFDDGRAQITVKQTDKGDNFDRIEKDLDVDDAKQAHSLLSTLNGRQQGAITKKYIVYVLDHEDTTVSVYQIKNDRRVFVEVEARTAKKIYSLIKSIEKVFPENKLIVSKKSLYQLFIKPKRR